MAEVTDEIIEIALQSAESCVACYRSGIISHADLKVQFLHIACAMNGIGKEGAQKIIDDNGLDIIVEDT